MKRTADFEAISEELLAKGCLRVVGHKDGQPAYEITEHGRLLLDDDKRRRRLLEILHENAPMGDEEWVSRACSQGMFEDTVRKDIQWIKDQGFLVTWKS